MNFPDKFIWGASTSAYQIEGAWNVDGKGLSVWDMFTRNGNHIVEAQSGQTACNHYYQSREDIALFRHVGLQAYRFSISWPRIFPHGEGRPNPRGIAFYDRLVDDLLEAGIQPWVTLFHWDYPYELFLRGGWLNPESPEWFARYTAAVVKKLSDRVTHWIPQSDLQCFIGLGHLTGEHAPGLKLDLPEVLLAAHHALLAHGRAVQTIRSLARKPPTIGCAPSGTIFYPASPASEDVEAAQRATLAVYPETLWNNTWWSDPLVFGHYPEDGLRIYGKAVPRHSNRDFETICQPLDFFGCNIFQGVPVKAGADGTPVAVPFEPGHPQTFNLWKQTPEAVYWGARFLGSYYKLPIILTENGVSCADPVSLDGQVHDPERIDFLTKYLLQIGRAMNEGIDIRGYFYWSAMDNFEWQDGYKHRFGLIHVDYPTQRRTLKDSANWYRDIISTNGRQLSNFLPEGETQTPYLIKEAIRYTHSHIQERFNIQDLANHLRCHPDFLSRKFKAFTGVDLSLYIRRSRIDHARDLLRNPRKSIDMVAEESGFSDRIHFAKVFRRLTGQTPGQYQRQFRLSQEEMTSRPLPSLTPIQPRSSSF